MNKSFLKWAGGKYKILPTLIPILDKLVDKNIPKQTFIEPFLGSGTVFLNFNKVDNFILNDSNKDLINLFSLLQEDESFIEKCQVYFKSINNDKEFYKKIVKKYNESATMEQRTHMFLYLNKHCFNGLMRFNKSGYFNTPFGKYNSVGFPLDSLNIMRDKITSNTVTFLSRDFEIILENSGFGDIVYCDPPYVDIEEKNSFKQYGKNIFDLEKQKKLAVLAFEAAQRGAKVVISNHYTPVTKDLYKNCSDYKILDVKRTIAAAGEDRKTVKEIIAIYNF